MNASARVVLYIILRQFEKIIERLTTVGNTIVIIGAGGNMGSGLAKRLSAAGHRVLLAGSAPSALDALRLQILTSTPGANVERLDCSREASWEADVIIPAVPYSAQAEVARRIKDVACRKAVISLANPLNEAYDGLVTPTGTSAAEELADVLPNAMVVKAFNTVFSAQLVSPAVTGTAPDCFVAGDHEGAIELVSGLVRDCGFHPVFAGGLEASRTLEAMMVIMIGIVKRNQYNWQTGWKVWEIDQHASITLH